MEAGKTAGQAIAHNSGGIVAGSIGSAVAIIFLPEEATAGVSVLASSAYNFAYDHFRGFHNFIDQIGNLIDKYYTNPKDKVYREQGQSVMKYTPYPY